MLIRQVVYVFGLLGVVWYAIHWYNDWFKKHADEEFRAKAMLLDIERASWVVETALEWQHDSEREIPAELLDRLTTGLFAEKGLPVTSEKNDLASRLVGASSKLSLKLGDQGAIELDRKGTRQFEKEGGGKR